MYQNVFVAVSDLGKKQSEVLEMVKDGKIVQLVRNNQPLGYLVGNDELVTNLLKLNDKDKVSKAEKFFEITMSKPWQESFMARYGGLQPAEGDHYIDRLLGLEGAKLMKELLPIRDHYTLWTRDGKPEIFTMQVYDMEMGGYKRLYDFCIRHGLTFRTERRSWYLPGVSTLIVISRKGANQ